MIWCGIVALLVSNVLAFVLGWGMGDRHGFVEGLERGAELERARQEGRLK